MPGSGKINVDLNPYNNVGPDLQIWQGFLTTRLWSIEMLVPNGRVPSIVFNIAGLGLSCGRKNFLGRADFEQFGRNIMAMYSYVELGGGSLGVARPP